MVQLGFVAPPPAPAAPGGWGGGVGGGAFPPVHGRGAAEQPLAPKPTATQMSPHISTDPAHLFSGLPINSLTKKAIAEVFQ